MLCRFIGNIHAAQSGINMPFRRNLHDQLTGRPYMLILNSFIVYIKEGEQIVDILNIMGAHSCLLELENIRIMKEMRNNVNRLVNCETANLSKTVNAAVRQVESIKIIQSKIGLKRLPQNLREIAELRLEYPDESLKELGEMLDPPVGKSGVNHRLRKIEKKAEELRSEI